MAKRMSTLNIDNVIWSFDLDLGLKNVLLYLSQNIDINRAIIYLYNEKSNTLYSELVYMNGSILMGDEEIFLSEHNRDRRVRMVLEKKTLVSDCYITIPLIHENKVYGLFMVDRSLSKTRFNKKEIAFIKQIANLIKTGIYQNSILVSRDTRIRQLNVLLEVSTILHRKSRSKILRFIGLTLIKFGKFDRVRLYIQDKPGQFIRVVSESIFTRSGERSHRTYGLQFFSGRITSDIFHIMRMDSNDGPVGFIEVDNIISQTRIDEAQVNFLNIIANQLAISLSNIFLMEKLKRISNTDPLTGAYNYRYLIEHLQKEASRSSRFKQTFSVLMFDIDSFKQINDRYGHLAGDEVLRSLVQTIRKQTRDIDMLSRYGGDEFILVASSTDRINATILANKLIDGAPELHMGKDLVKVKFSIGIATYPEDTNDITKLIKTADKRLYQAKKQGKHQAYSGE
jgi:diguanylate cyclase (GGDEF)-like protein